MTWSDPLPDPEVGLARAMMFAGLAGLYSGAIAATCAAMDAVFEMQRRQLENQITAERQQHELDLVLAQFALHHPAPTATPPAGA